MKKNITIKEIAKKSGVSVSTVSRVLNNHPSVSPVKRAKVQAIIEEESFQPSMLARGMVSNQTKTLAVVVSDITNPYFTSLVSEIELASQDQHYSLLLFNTMTAGHKKKPDGSFIEKDTFNTILEKKVDGVLILGGEIDRDDPNPDYLKALNQLNKQIPVLIIGQAQKDCTCSFLERDLEKGVFLAMQHLLALGYRRIGFIGGESGVKITTQRVQAFEKALSLYSTFDASLLYLSDFYTEDGYQSMTKIIQEQETLPDAVLAINDRVAIGAFRALKDKQLSCPEDIAIASCDAFPDGEYQIPRITTINQHNQILGQLAVKRLLKLINEEPLGAIDLHSPDLIIRESCGIQRRT
ncbi:LacI family DNA-binding transcriptional regulator [Enterococcus sp. BWM-S5]|uniref:LacI family DNA-binding transcriptional regulator n=1 Tax=Enterococcus larvae TaxID=2794352 RepID=A0ABS4CEG9_9ENTE|nr:LacI family DNA-binding transcriptional regulator [Enterococcus larvae]MBP1045015.1 LacI family DNA-binding transcriptional regulator [Enterococcus larvae]